MAVSQFERAKAAGGQVRRVDGPSLEYGLGAREYVEVCYRRGRTFRGPVQRKLLTAAEERRAALRFGRRGTRVSTLLGSSPASGREIHELA